LGGFAFGEIDQELYTRWLQMGTFNPIYRPHGGTHPAEPIFFNDTTKRIVREYIKLRYRMMPYNYTLAWQQATKGLPLTTPLLFEEPNNETVRNIDDTYYWGRNILVAPVTEKGQKTRNIYIPKGDWIYAQNDSLFNGNNWVTLPVELENIPYFFRKGSFIPMVPDFNSTDYYSSKNLIIHYYPSFNNLEDSYTMYEDDGKTNLAWEKGLFELLHFKGTKLQNELAIYLNRDGGEYIGKPNSRMMEFVIHRFQNKPSSIKYNNQTIPLCNTESEFKKGRTNGFWNKKTQKLFIKLEWKNKEEQLSVRY
jgi:oligosaccharide 4-alpha-D-glucosyltransferase